MQQKLVKKITSFGEEKKIACLMPTEQMPRDGSKEIGALQNAHNYITIVLQARLGEVS